MQHEKIIERNNRPHLTLGVDILPSNKYSVKVKMPFSVNGSIWADVRNWDVTPEEILTAKLELWEQLKPI